METNCKSSQIEQKKMSLNCLFVLNSNLSLVRTLPATWDQFLKYGLASGTLRNCEQKLAKGPGAFADFDLWALANPPFTSQFQLASAPKSFRKLALAFRSLYWWIWYESTHAYQTFRSLQPIQPGSQWPHTLLIQRLHLCLICFLVNWKIILRIKWRPNHNYLQKDAFFAQKWSQKGCVQYYCFKFQLKCKISDFVCQKEGCVSDVRLRLVFGFCR